MLADAERLRVGEQRYRAIFENVAEPVLTIDVDGIVVDANEAADEMFGRPMEGVDLTVTFGTDVWREPGRRGSSGRPRGCRASQPGTDAVALAAVVQVQLVQHADDAGLAPARQPLEGPGRVVDAQLHRRIGGVGRAHALLHRIPVVRSIYSGVKQVSDTLFSEKGNAFRKAVLVRWPHEGMWTIAFLTGTPAGQVLTTLREQPGARDVGHAHRVLVARLGHGKAIAVRHRVRVPDGGDDRRAATAEELRERDAP